MLKRAQTFYNDQEKIWSGPRTKDVYSSEMTIGEAIVMQLQKTPKKIIQIMDTTGETLTAQEFLNHSMALASNMLKMGLKSPDIVGLYAHHSVHLVTVMMSAFLCGTPVHGVFHGFDKDTVITLYGNTRPKIIFCDKENYENAQIANEKLQLEAHIVLLTGCQEGVTHINDLLEKQDTSIPLHISHFPCAKLNSSDTAIILSSSGTTGTPKGVMCSHHALLHCLVYHSITSDSILLCFSTMYWASGVMHLIAALLNSCLRIVPDKTFTPEYFLDLVERYEITHTFANVTQMAEVALRYSTEELRKSLKSIDTIVCGGTKVPQTVREKFYDVLADKTKCPGFCIGFGMSELMGALCISDRYTADSTTHNDGQMWLNKMACIVNEEGQRLGPNESGEILVHSPYTWLGYYNNPEATAKAKDGMWIHTGDMGYFNNLGFLHVMGRFKDMFKWKNFQICPQPIEEVILRIPGVAKVCVFPIPDLVADNLVACAIVKADAEEGRKLTEDMVHEFMEHNMDSYYHLRGGVYFLDDLPTTDTGKVQRYKMAELIVGRNESTIVHK